MAFALASGLLATACEPGLDEAGGDDALSTQAKAKIGQNHPSSGAFSPVDEAHWKSGTWPLGARFTAGEGSTLQVAVYSAHATAMLLETYAKATGADANHDYWMQRGTDGVWRAQLAKVPGKTLYAMRAWGPNWPYVAAWGRGNSAAGFVTDVDAAGNRFNPNKVLFDPYARELSHDKTSAALLRAGEKAAIYLSGGTDVDPTEVYSGPSTKNVAVDRRIVDTGRYVPKAIAFEDHTATGSAPHIAQSDSLIYEAHVKSLTAHPSAARLSTILAGMSGFASVSSVPDKLRGTYAGAATLAPYLKALGYNTLELLPIHESNNETNPTSTSGGNYWSYMTDGFFAPDRHWAHDQTPGGPTKEFKAMVKAFHAAGIEVWLDVVYNHSGEGGVWDAARRSAEITSFRGLDNSVYYALPADHTAYWVSTGCGNNLDASQKATQTLVKDSLSYWSSTMGVDGFRFDLAPVLGRDKAPSYDFNPKAQLLLDIASMAASGDYKVVAEAWDLNGYEVGNFPAGWGDWNGRYRDAVRRYLKGFASGQDGLNYAAAFYGDYDHYASRGGPSKTVNLITTHDGFTLADLVSYSAKTNLDRHWPFGPSDGGNDSNDSWNWWQNQPLRRQVIRNFLTFQMLSRGVPLTVWGDELGRTVNGNNNGYDVDSVATWTNYDQLATDHPQAVPTGDATGGKEVYDDNLGVFTSTGKNGNLYFLRSLIALRKAHPALRAADYSMPIYFTRADGSGSFNGFSDLLMRAYVQGSAVGDDDILVLSNMTSAKANFTVQAAPTGRHWVRVVDTDGWAESQMNAWTSATGATVAGSYGVSAWSMVVLLATP
jgi:isoamylase